MIETRIESERGCGYRKPGGLYLVGGKLAKACGRLPIALTVCPCCMQGIKFSRGFSWISSRVIENTACAFEEDKCTGCQPWSNPREQKFGLLWVGEKFYPRPADFIKEGHAAGVSKRIATVPKDLVVGETWVMLAHRKACLLPERGEQNEFLYGPGIFSAFIPTAIEYIVTGNESPSELGDMEKRGITLINVIPDTKTQMTLDQMPMKKTRKQNLKEALKTIA